MMYLQASFLDSLNGLWPLAMMFLVVYFFFMRPQSKRAKEQSTFLTDLKKGDKVVTNGGIVGSISKLDDLQVTLEVDNKSYTTFLRSSISHELTKSLNPDAK